MSRNTSAAVRQSVPFLLVTVLLAIPFHLKPENFAVDDGYFYLQIARNIAKGMGSTFNGWLPTNGYHPLWMLVCCACAWVTTNTNHLLHLVSFVQDALTVLSIGIIVRFARKSNMQGIVFGCAVLWFMSDIVGIWRLLETSLSLTLQLISLAVIVFRAKQQEKILNANLGIGALLGLTLLARLDLIFFITVLLVYPWIANRAGTLLKQAFASALQLLGVVAVVAPYLAWNYSHFHHFAPISGAIKSTFPHIHPVPAIALDTKLVIAGVLINLTLIFRKNKTPFETVCIVTAVSATLHLAYCLLYGSLWPWYLTTGDLSLALALIWIANITLRALQVSHGFDTAVLVTVFVAMLAGACTRVVTNVSGSRLRYGARLSSLGETYKEPRKVFAERLRASFPQGTRFFIFDSPGSVAYYSGMSITPSDGLVLDYAYNSALASEGFPVYARQHSILYMIVPIVRQNESYSWIGTQGTRKGDTQFITVDVPLTGRPAGTVALRDDALLFRAKTIQPGFEAYLPEVGVWRLP